MERDLEPVKTLSLVVGWIFTEEVELTYVLFVKLRMQPSVFPFVSDPPH